MSNKYKFSGGAIPEFAEYIKTQLSALGITTTNSQVEAILDSWRSLNEDAPLTLSTTQPDFEQIRLRLMDALSNADGWSDILTAGIGQTILEFIAAMGAFAQFGIERGVQEAFFDSATNETSIYTLARTEGVHLIRKRPPIIEATLTRSDTTGSLIIPALTQFSVNGIPHFNRTAYAFSNNVSTINVNLYQGSLQSTTFNSTGDDFQKYSIGPQDWSTSDDDIWVTIGGESFTKVTKGLWEYGPTSTVFYENTLPTGDVELVFGNNINGVRPSINSIINVTWAVTTGNSGPFASQDDNIICTAFPELTGTVTVGSRYGDNERDVEFYRILSPSLYSSADRAVTKQDYKATILKYPTVLDAVVRGQKDIDADQTYALNRVEITLLTSQEWSDTDWSAFTAWLDSRYGVLALNYVKVDPTPTTINVTLNIWCKPQSDLAAVERGVELAVSKFFSPRLGLIGYPVYLSDLHNAIISSSDSIDYVQINAPTTDTSIGSLAYAALGTLSITTHWSNRGTIQGV